MNNKKIFVQNGQAVIVIKSLLKNIVFGVLWFFTTGKKKNKNKTARRTCGFFVFIVKRT